MPMNPVSPDNMPPATNASVRKMPDAPNDNASELSAGLMTFVDVRNTMTASGTRITPMVLNWRFRYAIAPSWIALAISFIFGVPWSAASTPRMR